MLVQPFDVGTWTQIRMGMLYSLTTTGNSNGLYTSESRDFGIAGDGIYVGIKDTGIQLPLQSGSLFIGAGTAAATGNGATSLTGITIQGFNGQISLFGSSGNSGIQCANIAGIYPTSPANATGNTAFAAFFGVRIEGTGIGTSGQSFRITASNGTSGAGTSNTSLPWLRSQLGYLTGDVNTPYLYYTTGFENGGGPLPLPTSFFAYSPFLSNRLRIHGFVVERYEPAT